MIIIKFKLLEQTDKAIFDSFFHDRYYENSHCNFTNLFMWRNPYQIAWAVKDEVLYLKGSWQGKEFAMQPFGPKEKMPKAIGFWLNYFKEKNTDFIMSGLEKSMVEEMDKHYPKRFHISEDRDNFDYVYETAALISLSGRKYHSKKNHLNSFKKTYPEAIYQPITSEISLRCKLSINTWYKQHGTFDDPILTEERKAIIEVLNNFEYLNLKGGAIFIGERVVAFTFGEQLNENTAVIHVEKADPEIRGAYTAINQAFCQREWAHLQYVNREEDMGIEGLRKAKLSYKPVKMVEKFVAVLKDDLNPIDPNLST